MDIFTKLSPGNILYYPGCLTKSAIPNLKKRYEEILRKLGVDFILLTSIEVCCGSPVLNSGFDKEFKKLAEKNLKIFKDHGVKKIITNCPACFKIFLKDYPKILGKKWDIKTEHITQTLAKAKLKFKLKNLKLKTVTYHDPCHLGRKIGVYDEPRRLIKNAGYKVKEMRLNKEFSFCCGGGGGVKANNPKLSNKIAKERAAQAKEVGARCLITSCPLCLLHLKENAKDLKIKEISEILI